MGIEPRVLRVGRRAGRLQPAVAAITHRNHRQIIVYLLLFWSVHVKGHIIARTINREWYVGLVIAIAVFILQYAFSTAVSPAS